MQQNPQPLLDVDDVAERLGVNRRFVYGLVTNGHIDYLRIGPKLLKFRPDAIDGYLARCAHPAVAS